MGCFLASCFRHSKRRKPKKSPSSSNHILKPNEAVHPLDRAKEEPQLSSVSLNADSLEKVGEQIELCHSGEKTSDPIVEDDAVVPTQDVENVLDEVKKEEKSGLEDDEPRGSSNLSTAFSLPLNHRYADCRNSNDDECVEEMDLLDEGEGRKDDGDGRSELFVQQESSESLFSLSLGSRKQICAVEAGENEVNSPAPSHCSCGTQPEKASPGQKTGCQNRNADSVLAPIENVTHLNAARVKTVPPVRLEKENIDSEKDYDVPISPEPTPKRPLRKLKENHSNSKPAEDEIAVDTSLSNWLIECDTTPKSKSSSSSIGNSPMWTRNSAKSYEDRPILGALTLEELRQFSAFSTPRRSRSRSPEETPIIGTVGSYWSHTRQDADFNPGSSSPCTGSTKTARKNREDERVNWNSTPFLERLDRALASNSAEV
ncbi:uncharacterized protein LOC111018155 [Momordica charantia]|uniref:Uncharacterized protein LOC111018155 n=1 Tax=Momordica charantia TaxID=3673 RepID=A0A6J1D6S3_MOMCH|nr:uncharacterized protein LOC111018155 [Momordica charantia]